MTEVETPTRWRVFERAIQLCRPSACLVVAETGVSAERSNGLSTHFWATCPRVAEVHCVDMDRESLSKALGEIANSDAKVRAVATHSLCFLAGLADRSIDLLYLDSDEDPVLTMHEFLVALPKLRPGAIVLMDDVRTKGALLRKLVKGEPIPFGHKPYGRWSMQADISGFEELDPDMMLFRLDEARGFSAGGMP